MSNEANGPYYSGYDTQEKCAYVFMVGRNPPVMRLDMANHVSVVLNADAFTQVLNSEHHSALTTQAARVKELEEDREWLRSQWERHRKALNAIAWGEYDNVAFCRRLAQDELAIGVKVANDRAAATVAALTPKEPQQ